MYYNQLTYEFVKGEFESNGFELLDSEYKNSVTKMKYRCSKHSDVVQNITYKRLRTSMMKNQRMNAGCKLCANEYLSEIKRLPFEKVKQEFEKCGYVLLDTECEYKNNSIKLRYRCPHHPNEELKISYGNLQSGKRCYLCSKIQAAKSRMYDYNIVKQDFEKRGYKLLETEYLGVYEKMKFICPKHPDKPQRIRYVDLKLGCGCRLCGRERTEQSKRLPFDLVKKQFEERGYKLLDEVYINCDTPMRYMCPHHPEVENKISYDHLKRGQGCRSCSSSKGEKHISSWLRTNDITFIQQKTFDDCKFENILKFDFYIPIYNLLIEYQGQQHYEPVDFGSKGGLWANNQFEITKQRDQVKRDYCSQNNIRLLEIPYWEFDNINNILSKEVGGVLCV